MIKPSRGCSTAKSNKDNQACLTVGVNIWYKPHYTLGGSSSHGSHFRTAWMTRWQSSSPCLSCPTSQQYAITSRVFRSLTRTLTVSGHSSSVLIRVARTPFTELMIAIDTTLRIRPRHKFAETTPVGHGRSAPVRQGHVMHSSCLRCYFPAGAGIRS